MASKIILKKSSVAAKAPVAGDLDFGELAINYTDSKLYFKKADGNIDAFTTAAASAPVTSVGGNIGDITDAQLLASIKSVDGSGSGLDADLLDGNHASDFYLASNPNGYTSNTGTVTSVGATSPLVSSGGTAPSLSIPAANSTTNGYMSSAYASKLDGIAAGATNVTNTNQLTNGAGYITSTASITGNAATATALQTARTINGVGFNGTANITVADATKQPLDADLTAIAALAGTSGLLRKTAADTWSLDTNTYVTSSGVTSVSGTAPIVSSGGTTPAISITTATTSAAGSMSSADKTKLDGIAAGAQVNVATNLGYTAATRVLTSSTGTSVTLPQVTTSVDGLMIAADKTKLNGIATGATANTGTVTSVATSGTVSGLTLTGGTITTTGTITLGGTLSVLPSNFASQTANTVLAAPNGSAGTPTFRILADADIPALTMAKLPGAAYKQSVRCATTANITLSGTQTIDGIAVVAGNRVLVKNQTTASQNGIYIVAAGTWTRSADADAADEIGAAVVNVDSGTLNGGELWTTTFKTTDVLGTTVMNWYEVLYNTGSWGISITGSSASTTGNAATATTATNVSITNDTASTATHYIMMGDATSGTDGVKISTTKVSFQPSTGNLTIAGNLAANSDERLKKDWLSLPDTFLEDLSKVKSGTYTRVDNGERQAGASAQDWQKLLPEVVVKAATEEGTLALAYGNAALVSAIELAKKVVSLEERLAKLEKLIQ